MNSKLFRPQTQQKERRALKILDDGQSPPPPPKKGDCVSELYSIVKAPYCGVKDKVVKTVGEK